MDIRIIEAFRDAFKRKQDNLGGEPGILGRIDGLVKVDSRPWYVYVGMTGRPLSEVYNVRVPNIAGLQVLVGYDPLQPKLLQVLAKQEIAIYGYDGVPTPYNIPEHAETHRWMADPGGNDVLFVELRQFLPFRIVPTGGMNIGIFRGILFANGAWQTWESLSTTDLTSYIPSTEEYERYVLICLDNSLAVQVTAGVVQGYESLALNDIPAPPTDAVLVLGAVRLYEGQTVIAESRTATDIVDLRFPQAVGGGAGIATSAMLALQHELDFTLTNHIVTGG